MQNPGVSRAIPMGIIGFLVGALIVITIRGLQGLDPLWNPGVGIIFGTLFCAGFFVWGMGAFNPKLSEHGEGAGHHEQPAEAEGKLATLLTSSVWQIATLLVLTLIVLFAFAAWGGLTLTTTADPLASTTNVGYFTLALPFNGPEVQLSELVVFVLFVLWVFVSLAIAAVVLAWMFGYFHQGLKESQAEASVGLAALPSGSAVGALPSGEVTAATSTETTRSQVFGIDPVRLGVFAVVALAVFVACNNVLFSRIFPQTPDVQLGLSLIIAFGVAVLPVRPFFLGSFLFTFVLLYYLFWWALIGLVLPGEPLRTLTSLVNALIFAFLILRPTLFLQVVGRLAGLLARFVRWLPKLLVQR
jgi:hypothetical protein